MASRPDPYAALRHPGYRCFLGARALYVLGVQMQTVAVSWQIYQRLHDTLGAAALALGYIGLVQVIPIILFSLPAGQAADRFNRRTIILITQLVFACSALSLLLLSRFGGPVPLFYTVLFAAGIGRAFATPSVTAFYTNLVPREIIPNASTWNSTVFQLTATIGPAIGGFIVAQAGPEISYAVNIACAACGFLLMQWTPRHIANASAREPVTFHSLLGGLRFVFGTRLLLSMVSLDLFAVLLGGATALLPIYANDILHVGATGFGLLRAAPAIGAVIMALITTHLRPWKHPGRAMLLAVAGFGVATLVFGLSKLFWLSLGALFVTGLCDNISVVVRQTLMQMITPNHMRGRVSSVSFIFVSCSNELGEFESGLTARWLGPVESVVFGGIGTLLVVASAAWLIPEIRRLGSLQQLKPVEVERTTTQELASTTSS